MPTREKVFLLAIFLAVLLIYSSWGNASDLERQNGFISIIQFFQEALQNSTARFNQQTQQCPILESLTFIRSDNKGNGNVQGVNYVLVVDPKAKDLDFKVNLGLTHKLYDKDDNGKYTQKYIPKLFKELISDENSTLDGKQPIAAINADYLGSDNKPEGLNFSRGVEYSGAFKGKRSSFAISGGKPEERKATIQIGRRKQEIWNYNVVGGNGRFYKGGQFKNICPDLGDYICTQTSRSLVAITSKGYVIFLVNSPNLNLEKALYPSRFNVVLKGIADNYCLGNIQEGILFDGGFSTGFYFEGNIYVENPHPVGSVFLIYKK